MRNEASLEEVACVFSVSINVSLLNTSVIHKWTKNTERLVKGYLPQIISLKELLTYFTGTFPSLYTTRKPIISPLICPQLLNKILQNSNIIFL